MVDWLATTITLVSLVLAGWFLVSAFRDRPMVVPHLVAMAGLELLLLAQVAVAITFLAGGERPEELPVFISYLVTVALVPPACAAWGLMERSRWGPAVISFACFILPVLIVRLQQLWDPSRA